MSDTRPQRPCPHFAPTGAGRGGASAFSSSTAPWARRSRSWASSEAHFRGERFADCECHLQGNNDLLTLTQPQAIEDIHFAYAMAGADILETNTFSSTSIAQADYGMEEVVYELNRDGARLARARRAEGASASTASAASSPARSGPTNRTASISPDVNNPGFRAVTFRRFARRLRRAARRPDRRRRRYHPDRDDLRHAERQGGDLRLRGRFRRARRAPAGDDLRHDHRPFRPHAVRPDADRVLALGAPRQALHHRPQLRARRRARCARISPRSRDVADTFVCAYPNAGLPNEFGLYDESPEEMAAQIGDFARAGLVNIVGGCCGSTPDAYPRDRRGGARRRAARTSRTSRR